jgi:hypothetical protein
MTTEKEWKIGEITMLDTQNYICEIVRVEDDHCVKKILLNPETLPPRMTGKKVAWQLPTDGSIPKLGIHEQVRVINLFKESRKKGKKEKKSKDGDKTLNAVEIISRNCLRHLWRCRFDQWLKVARASVSSENKNALSQILSAPPGIPFPIAGTETRTIFARPPGIPMPLVTSPSVELDEETTWKITWKQQYLLRLDALAEIAWQNHRTKTHFC